MKYAIVNGFRTEAEKSLKGTCPICGEIVIAKCGSQKINHWAHKSNNSCDKWHEVETEWHRKWKNNFPDMYQEVVITDRQFDYAEGYWYDKEKHIADIYLKNFVIEFQHSHISEEEQESREKFYTQEGRNMVWVVDGTRLKNDYKRFLKEEFYGIKNVYYTNFPDWVFPKNWLNRSVPVFFDFLGLDDIENADGSQKPLYCLLHGKIYDMSVFIPVSRKSFINLVINGDLLNKLALKKNEFTINYYEQKLKEEREYRECLLEGRVDTIHF